MLYIPSEPKSYKSTGARGGMERRWTPQDVAIIALILVITISLRLYLAYDTPFAIGEESAHWYRQANSILETGKPISQDTLYQGGRVLGSFPVFAYFVALPTWLFGFEAGAKLFTNLSAAVVSVLAFMICLRTTNSRYVAYLTSFFAGFIPIYWQNTVQQVSIYSLVIPLFIWCLYLFIEIVIGKRQVVGWYVLSLLLYALIHPTVLLLIGGLFIYLLMLKVEDMKVTKAELELVLFSSLIAMTLQVIINKDVLFAHGAEVIWQNIPSRIVGAYFTQTTLLQAFYRIGEIPVLFGIVIIAKYLFKEKDKTVYLFISYALMIGTALWLRIIEPGTGMMFLGAILVLLFSFYYTLYLDYVPSTRFHKFLPVFKTVFFLTFIITSVVPAVELVGTAQQEARMDKHIEALEWLEQHAKGGAVFAQVEHGAMIAAYAHQPIIADTNFLHVYDATERVEDIEKLFTSPYETIAAQVMQKRDGTYILVDKAVMKQKYNETELPFFDRFQASDCFARVHQGPVDVYQKTCEVKVSS